MGKIGERTIRPAVNRKSPLDKLSKKSSNSTLWILRPFKKAYATVVYGRTIGPFTKICMAILACKTRVAQF